MELVSYIVIFTIVWWILFFISLPVGITIPNKVEKGFADSAPTKPYIGIKIVIVSILSMFITWGILILINKGYMSYIIGE